jgi:REP element-mobilizing transposase RayT
MAYYHRNLPHWHPEGSSIFLTWRLFGSLPAPPKSTAKIVCATESPSSKLSSGRKFKQLDSLLDKASSGPLWLNDPAIAQTVTSAIHLGAEKLNFYALHAYVVMPNHVHILITPKVPVSRITNGLKGVTARDANAILHRTGQHFWQDESFDHWVRDAAQFDSIRTYVENNPVSAGLTTRPEHWPWSSATQLKSW